ncbi:MAG: aromatic-ring-hydroxylating dioxygenase subunit beta [Cellvibrionaceae bacterium]|nr:aromatic-ring-hydroxylating dioxygenase subunit beta [Cellvibrionaceae bacterium]MCV6624801.1 aromatic-ring-hydroxylating dioxygenase subunit beta [Cellvibrionaceae bacterium]
MSNFQRPGLKKIETFLYHETGLLDRMQLRQWIDLFTDSGDYWMPVKPDQEDPINHISIFYDDRDLMEIRLRHFNNPRSHSKDFDIRSSHVLGNIQIVDFNERNGDCSVSCNFQCIMYYREKQDIFAGTCLYSLVRGEGQGMDAYKIQRKRVDLINCDAPHGSIQSYV